jgi:hypothetical protein
MCLCSVHAIGRLSWRPLSFNHRVAESYPLVQRGEAVIRSAACPALERVTDRYVAYHCHHGPCARLTNEPVGFWNGRP